MGYTNYWYRTDKPITQEFVDGVKRIIKESEKKGISIRGGDGTGEPEVTLEKISFNGNAEFGLDYESCYMNNGGGKGTQRFDEGIFSFCKTARKPYDYTVKRVLRLAKKYGIISEWSDDGKCKVQTDEEYLSELSPF